MHKMEKLANDRLNEMIAETEVALAGVRDEGTLTLNELNKLKGW